jgi:hypothetical protein
VNNYNLPSCIDPAHSYKKRNGRIFLWKGKPNPLYINRERAEGFSEHWLFRILIESEKIVS